jgi:hypothetical protein
VTRSKYLYEAFWERNRPRNKDGTLNQDWSYTPWDKQAEAIKTMWINIAEDSEDYEGNHE